MIARALGALAALALLVPAAAAAQTAEPRTNLADIEDEVICLVCGTTLELAEGAPQAERLREQIRGLIDQGLTKEQVKDELVAEYGENVLSTPDTEGFDLSAWVLPIVGLLGAAAAIGVGLARSRRRGSAPAADEISDEDRKRLDADLASFDR